MSTLRYLSMFPLLHELLSWILILKEDNSIEESKNFASNLTVTDHSRHLSFVNNFLYLVEKMSQFTENCSAEEKRCLVFILVRSTFNA